MKSLFDRRNFGKFLLASALALGNVFGNPSDITPANQALRDFPTNIPGIESVKRYETPGANQTIVHIRQSHYVPCFEDLGEVWGLSEEHKKKLQSQGSDYVEGVGKCQRNIYSALDYLINSNGLKKVYLEGLDVTETSLREDALKGYSWMVWEELAKKGYYDSFKDSENLKYIPGAGILLASQRRVMAKGIEDKDLNEAAGRGSYVERCVNQELREDYILEILSKSKDPISYLVLGSNHALAGNKSFENYKLGGRGLVLKDNIHYWNKKNPEHKYSLIELDPKND